MNCTLEISEINRTVGQLFMAGMPGPNLDEKTERLISDYNLSGIILFSRNIVNPLQLADLCRDLQEAAIRNHGVPLFIAVDQEGGRVARLKEPFTIFPGNESIGSDEAPEERAREFGIITAREMNIVGLNMNFAPVVDVRRGEPEKHLKGRTFSEDSKKVALLGKTVVRSLQDNGIMAVAKHFPGLGLASMDPHFNLPRIDSDIREIENINLPPFKAVMEEGVSGIMSSHAIYPALDPARPATLSFSVLQGLLREKMGFQGLIITDDLEMGAIAKGRGIPQGAVDSFLAGADILLVCENQDELLESIHLVRKNVLQDKIPQDRLNQSAKRIMEAKTVFLKGNKKISRAKVKKYFKL